MSNHLVRVWKDPDERGAAAHPSGEIDLAALSGGGGDLPPTVLAGCPQTWFPHCTLSLNPSYCIPPPD